LDAVVKRKNPGFCRESYLSHPACSFVTVLEVLCKLIVRILHNYKASFFIIFFTSTWPMRMFLGKKKTYASEIAWAGRKDKPRDYTLKRGQL